jgi:hypothetical protein
LKYGVQNNVLVKGKLKEGEKSHFLKKLCRASTKNARQRYMFAVRQGKTHGKQSVFAVRFGKTHGKGGHPLRGIAGQRRRR